VTQPPTQRAAPIDPIDPVDPTPIPDASSPGTVPTDLVGTSSADVERALGDLGLRVRRIAVRSSAPDGQVLATIPRAGAATAPGQSVLVVASAGRDHGRDGGDGWVVPRWLVGAKADRLSRGLRGRGITPVAVPVASDQPRGTVVATYPGPGAAVRSGQLVLATSTGKPAADRP
jgi:serine/threonine-protein kinase